MSQDNTIKTDQVKWYLKKINNWIKLHLRKTQSESQPQIEFNHVSSSIINIHFNCKDAVIFFHRVNLLYSPFHSFTDGDVAFFQLAVTAFMPTNNNICKIYAKSAWNQEVVNKTKPWKELSFYNSLNFILNIFTIATN